MLYRATTPTHSFTLPKNVSAYDVVEISYRQGNTKLVKCYDGTASPEFDINEKTISVTLSQQETLLFSKGGLSVHCRAKENGKVMASKKFDLVVEPSNNEEEL